MRVNEKKNLPNNITANDLEKVQESLKVAREEKKKRTVYTEKDKQDKVCGNLWSYSDHQKIPTKVPKLNRKYRGSIGKKSQKILTGAEEVY